MGTVDDDLAKSLGDFVAANRRFLARADHALTPVKDWLGAMDDGRDPRRDELHGKVWCLVYLRSMAGLSGLHDALLHFPRTDKARIVFDELVKDVMQTFERVVAMADSMEVNEAANATAGYFNRWGRLWRMHDDPVARAELDADWRRLTETMRSAVDGIKSELQQAVQEAKSRSRDGDVPSPDQSKDKGCEENRASSRPRTSSPLVRLRKLNGIAASEYVIDTKENTIRHRPKGKPERAYRIARGQSSAIVNRLVRGMVKGVRDGSWYVKFTDKDAHDMRRSGGDSRAFLEECIDRKAFVGHKIGNQRYADLAQLAH